MGENAALRSWESLDVGKGILKQAVWIKEQGGRQNCRREWKATEVFSKGGRDAGR